MSCLCVLPTSTTRILLQLLRFSYHFSVQHWFALIDEQRQKQNLKSDKFNLQEIWVIVISKLVVHTYTFVALVLNHWDDELFSNIFFFFSNLQWPAPGICPVCVFLIAINKLYCYYRNRSINRVFVFYVMPD